MGRTTKSIEITLPVIFLKLRGKTNFTLSFVASSLSLFVLIHYLPWIMPMLIHSVTKYGR